MTFRYQILGKILLTTTDILEQYLQHFYLIYLIHKSLFKIKSIWTWVHLAFWNIMSLEDNTYNGPHVKV